MVHNAHNMDYNAHAMDHAIHAPWTTQFMRHGPRFTRHKPRFTRHKPRFTCHGPQCTQHGLQCTRHGPRNSHAMDPAIHAPWTPQFTRHGPRHSHPMAHTSHQLFRTIQYGTPLASPSALKPTTTMACVKVPAAPAESHPSAAVYTPLPHPSPEPHQ
jgi:hypothetical protein